MSQISVFMVLLVLCGVVQAAVVVDRVSVKALQIVADGSSATGTDAEALEAAANLLAESLERHLGTMPRRVATMGDGPAIVIGDAHQYPKLAGQLSADDPDAFAIVTEGSTAFVIGATMTGARHGVASLLHKLGYRFYSPSPNWWIVPSSSEVTINLTFSGAPSLRGRGIWYAYGSSSKRLQANYQVWAHANRLGSAAPFQSGHSYASIILRNKAAFSANPEFYAMDTDGRRLNDRAPAASKFCFSNPQLQALVAADRLSLLREQQKANPLAFMVSVDPSDGRGTCHCGPCKALGTPTDRVLTLANHVARHLRKHDPKAWVGLYAYSTHRSPPTIAVEPNVYVQVALGFNRTPLTLPELVDAWSRKVGAIGLREYYGVEAWDWGLPGRLRGGQVSYHQKWIPYFAARRLNAVNAETNANWAAQTPGGYIAAQLMWDPAVKIDPLVDEFFASCFGRAEPMMRRLYARFDQGPPLEPQTLRVLFDDVAEAYAAETDPGVRARIVDLMAYLHYITLFREVSLTWVSDVKGTDASYLALEPLLNFAWRIAERDVIHYQALVRRLANALPLNDGRPEFWMSLTAKNRPDAKVLERHGLKGEDLPDRPVWMHGEPYTDQEVLELFAKSKAALAQDTRTYVYYSRYLDYAHAPGPDLGPSRSPAGREGAARFEGEIIAWLGTVDDAEVPLHVTPLAGAVEVTSYLRGDDVHEQFNVSETDTVTLRFTRANDYRVRLVGSFDLATAPDLPLVVEASARHPATIRRSGPLYFYVPQGVRRVVLHVDGVAAVHVPRHGVVVLKGTGDEIVVDVPEDAVGTLWHLTSATDGRVALINVPPLLHLHRTMFLSVREVSQSDGLTTVTPEEVEAGRWKP